MAIVAGVDFGTLSVRVTLLDSDRGRLGTASAGYPLHRRREDPDFATQSHEDQMRALAQAVRDVMQQTGVGAEDVVALSLDTTGSSVIPVDAQMQPLDEYMLWCDHRAHKEAQQITELAHATGLDAIEWCGGVYSHEWGCGIRAGVDCRRRSFCRSLIRCLMGFGRSWVGCIGARMR
jgi:L-ribulokinase